MLDEPPAELDKFRLVLRNDRQKRWVLVSQKIEHLMARMDAAVGTANSKVLLHFAAHRALVRSINHVGIAIDDFQRPLGIESGRYSLETTRWWDAARDSTQLKSAAVEVGRNAAIGAGAAVVGIVVWANRAAHERGEGQ